MTEPDESESCYEILGVDPGASSSEIRQAYRKLALAKHPDRGGDPEEFARLSKAYEVLSNAKSRANYDKTGRTSKLTAEEEFIEAFRSSAAEAAPQESARPPARRPRPENNRSGGVHSFSANVGTGSRSQAKDTAVTGDALASAVHGALGASFSPGARVRVVGLEKQQTLNSATGTLVKLHNDRWQVRLDGDLGDKLLKSKNLILEENRDIPEAKPKEKQSGYPTRVSVEESEPPRRSSFNRLSPDFLRVDSGLAIDIAGSWSSWKPQRMTMEPKRRCHKFQVQLPSSSSESFQLFVPGDGLGRCIHPDRADAHPHEFHRLTGPDDNSKGYSWTIGKHPNDKAVAGARYEVILIYAANGKPDRVDWVHLNPRTTTAPKTPFPARSGSNANKAYGGMTVAGFLQAAKPDWSAKEVTSVCEKLSKITVVDLPSLLRALQSEGSSGVNQRLKTAGEKAFTDQTARALRQHAKKVSDEETARVARTSAPPERAAPSPQTSASLPPLPTQEYRVVHEFAYVRQDPSLHSPLCGKKDQGETVHACEETFDGWIKLYGQPGYIIKDMAGKQGIGKILSAVGKQPSLVLPEQQATSTPLLFEVVYKPLVAVRTAPSKSRPIQGTRKLGEQVRADAQGFGGWIKVCAEDGGGWMLTADPDLGQLLSCKMLEQRQQQVKALHRAAAAGDAAALGDALHVAKRPRAGLGGEAISSAERELRQIREREAVRKDLLQRASTAKADGKDTKLRNCIEEADQMGFAQEKRAMQEALDNLLVTKAETQKEHDVLLDNLAAAAASGDVAQIKVARNAAKEGGVPMKEIARVFALHNSQAGA